jgi:hypothetical protein
VWPELLDCVLQCERQDKGLHSLQLKSELLVHVPR